MPKIDVITVKLTCHIPVDPGDMVSVQFAASCAEGLRVAGEKLGQTSYETHINRVTAPEPEAGTPAPVTPTSATSAAIPVKPGGVASHNANALPAAADDLEPPANLRRTAKAQSAAVE